MESALVNMATQITFLLYNATSYILGVDSQIIWHSYFECFEEPPYSYRMSEFVYIPIDNISNSNI